MAAGDRPIARQSRCDGDRCGPHYQSARERNQIDGAVVTGIGMALLVHTTYDPRNGAPINSNLADYIVAVNADVLSVDVHFREYPDKVINLEPAASARSAWLDSPLPSLPRSTTRRACACANCRSRSSTC